jgi:hypothetical protein
MNFREVRLAYNLYTDVENDRDNKNMQNDGT